MKARRLMITSTALLALPLALLIGAQQDVPSAAPVPLPDQSAVAPPGGEPDCWLRIVPPDRTTYGKTYGEWAAAWWQWALSIPADRNPVMDPNGNAASGELFAEGQSGPVWFHQGSFGFDAERWCTIPEGKMIFMPVYCWIFGEAVWDCGKTNPEVPCNVETLRRSAAENVLAARLLVVCIDGVPVWDVFAYRAICPEPFTITYPENSVFGLPADDYFPNVTDGFFLMLKPLPKGEHTIWSFVYAPDTPYGGTIKFKVITHLTVK